MSQNLNAAAIAAQLAEQDKKKIQAYQKALSVHKTLNNLPPDLAKEQAAKLSPAQQASLPNTFGNEDPAIKPERSLLGTAWHYTGGAVGDALGYTGSHLYNGLINISDFSTIFNIIFFGSLISSG